MFAGLLRRPGYQLHPPDSPEAEALLIERGLTRIDLDRALAELARSEGIQVRTIVGINDDGVFGNRRDGWRPTCPTPAPSPSSPFSGSRSWSCSAACPEAAQRTFSGTGRCRTDRLSFSHLRRRSLPPGGAPFNLKDA